MNHNEIYAYFAGIIDGEGTISMYYYKKLDRYFLTFEVYNNCPKIIHWLETNIGGYSRAVTSPSRESKIHWKTTYCWRLHNNDSLHVLQSVLPFLVSKKEQCEIAIEFKRSYLIRECPVSAESKEFRKSLYKRMQPLNQRGLKVPPCLPSA
jgi:hypothetical protein